MLGRRHVAQEVGAGAGGDSAADGCGDVVVAHADIGHQRPEHIERGVVAQALLQFHVGGDLVERHVTRALDHDLDAGGPGALAQLAELNHLGGLGGVVGVVEAARAAGVAERNRHVVLMADFEQLVVELIEGVLVAGDLHPAKQ